MASSAFTASILCLSLAVSESMILFKIVGPLTMYFCASSLFAKPFLIRRSFSASIASTRESVPELLPGVVRQVVFTANEFFSEQFLAVARQVGYKFGVREKLCGKIGNRIHG